jgi:hypothetical protein
MHIDSVALRATWFVVALFRFVESSKTRISLLDKITCQKLKIKFLLPVFPLFTSHAHIHTHTHTEGKSMGEQRISLPLWGCYCTEEAVSLASLKGIFR